MDVVSDQGRVSTGLGAKDGGGGWMRTLCGVELLCILS